jgi:hypothetical protein
MSFELPEAFPVTGVGIVALLFLNVSQELRLPTGRDATQRAPSNVFLPRHLRYVPSASFYAESTPLTIRSSRSPRSRSIARSRVVSSFYLAHRRKRDLHPKVKYPNLYASDAEAQADPAKKVFNCVQRSHANTLEFVPYVLSLFGYLSESL